MKDIIYIIIRPVPPDISAGCAVFILMFGYLIINWPDLNMWLIFFISLICGWFLTIPAGFFLLYQIFMGLYSAYSG
jgi:hypothetical protein